MLNFIKIIKFIIIYFMIFILLFLCAEISVRLYAHFLMDEKKFFRESNFISPWITTYDYPPPRMIDSEKGIFRNSDRIISTKKEPELIRIIAVGGSTTLNIIPYRYSNMDFTAELEKSLSGTYDHFYFEVLNAGADAYSSAQSLINIQFRLLDFNPDIILLMHNINDRTANYFLDGATGDYSNKYLQEFFINPELLTGLSFSGFLYQSRLLARLGLPQLLAEKRVVSYDKSIDNGLKYFKRNLLSICQIANKNNVNLILLTQPHQMKEFLFDGEEEHILIYNNAILEIAKQEGVHFIDMFSEFGHGSELFIDSVHYSVDGVLEFAKLIFPHLQNIINEKFIQ